MSNITNTNNMEKKKKKRSRAASIISQVNNQSFPNIYHTSSK